MKLSLRKAFEVQNFQGITQVLGSTRSLLYGQLPYGGQPLSPPATGFNKIDGFPRSARPLPKTTVGEMLRSLAGPSIRVMIEFVGAELVTAKHLDDIDIAVDNARIVLWRQNACVGISIVGWIFVGSQTANKAISQITGGETGTPPTFCYATEKDDGPKFKHARDFTTRYGGSAWTSLLMVKSLFYAGYTNPLVDSIMLQIEEDCKNHNPITLSGRTLAHELGHSLGLAHTQDEPWLLAHLETLKSRSNLMTQGASTLGTNGTELLSDQVARMRANALDSFLEILIEQNMVEF